MVEKSAPSLMSFRGGVLGPIEGENMRIAFNIVGAVLVFFLAAYGSCRESMCCRAVLCQGKCDGRCAAALQLLRASLCWWGLTGNGNALDYPRCQLRHL